MSTEVLRFGTYTIVILRNAHGMTAALDYLPSETEPFRSPLLVSGTVYPSTSLLHHRCLSSGHASRVILFTIFLPQSLTMHSGCAVALVILDSLTMFMLLTYLLPVFPNPVYEDSSKRSVTLNASDSTKTLLRLLLLI